MKRRHTALAAARATPARARLFSSSAGAALLFSALSGAARAQTPASRAEPARAKDTFALNWVRQAGAEGCVSSLELASLLEQTVGPVLRTPSEATVLVEGAVTRAADGSRWRAIIRVTDERGGLVGERELTHASASCVPLTRSILLVLAVILDPEAGDRGLPPAVVTQLSAREDRDEATPIAAFPGLPIPDSPHERSHEAPPPPPIVPPPTPRPKADAAIDRTAADGSAFGSTRVSAAAAVGSGHVPGVNLGGTVGVAVATGRTFHLDVGFSFWGERGVEVTGPYTNGGDVSFSAAHLTAALCHPLVRGRFEVSACAGGVAGLRFIRADALPRTDRTSRAYFGPLIGFESTWKMTDVWFVRATASAALTSRKDQYEYATHDDGWRVVFSPSLLLTSVTAGIGARL